MFFHNFKYTLKTLFKNKMLIFWTFAFPIILGTMFYLAFSNIENGEKLQIIDIAIVQNEAFENDEILKETFKTLGEENGKDQVFSINYTNEEKAKELLNKEEITGYILVNNDEPKIFVKQSGMNETVLNYVIGEIIQTKEMVNNIASEKIKEEMLKGNININYENIYKNVIDLINDQKVEIKDKSSSNLSYTMIEFYALIAMTCLYGATLGMYSINNILANMSTKGMRVEVSPIKRGKLLLSSSLASYVAQLIGLAILFLYTIFILNVDYGTRIFPVVLLAMIGSAAGLSFGVAVGILFKTNENVKIGIIIAFTMVGSFLSGMMGITMKYIVDKNAPIVNMLNPANMITDGFYSLYYYSTMERYWFNIQSLIIFSAIMILVSIIVLRRQKYDSI